MPLLHRSLVFLALLLTASCQALHTPALTLPRPLVDDLDGSIEARPASAPRADDEDEDDDEGFRAREGATLRLGGFLWGVQGDYDGETILVAPAGDIVIVPEYDPTTGPEVGIGYRGERYGFELTYKRIVAEGEFLGTVEDDTWNYLDLDFKEYYRRGSRLQPYFTLGLGYFFGTIVEGATDGVVITDADFTGISIQGGLGLAMYFSERLAIDVRGIYRYAETLDVDTVSEGTISIEDGLDASGYGVSFGVTYTF